MHEILILFDACYIAYGSTRARSHILWSRYPSRADYVHVYKAPFGSHPEEEVTLQVPFTKPELERIINAQQLLEDPHSDLRIAAAKSSDPERDVSIPWSGELLDRKYAMEKITRTCTEIWRNVQGEVSHSGSDNFYSPDTKARLIAVHDLLRPLVNVEWGYLGQSESQQPAS